MQLSPLRRPPASRAAAATPWRQSPISRPQQRVAELQTGSTCWDQDARPLRRLERGRPETEARERIPENGEFSGAVGRGHDEGRARLRRKRSDAAEERLSPSRAASSRSSPTAGRAAASTSPSWARSKRSTRTATGVKLCGGMLRFGHGRA
jgi:hypothetical protein